MVEPVSSAGIQAAVGISILRRTMDLQAMMVAQLLPSSPQAVALALPTDGIAASTAAGDSYAFSAEAVGLSEG